MSREGGEGHHSVRPTYQIDTVKSVEEACSWCRPLVFGTSGYLSIEADGAKTGLGAGYMVQGRR